jgi:hypothetical protein
MAAAAPDIPSTAYSSTIGNVVVPPQCAVANAAAAAGQRPHLRYGWHANANCQSMAAYSLQDVNAKAICLWKTNPQPPVRQLIQLQNPAAGGAGDRSDFFPNRPMDVRTDGTRATLIRGYGPAEGFHLERFSTLGRPTSFDSHSAPASWAHSTHSGQLPGGGPHGNGNPRTAAHIAVGKVPGVPVAGPMIIREQRNARGMLLVNCWDGTQEEIDVRELDTTVMADGVARRTAACRQHFSGVQISESILGNPMAAQLHRKSIENGGPGFNSHWLTIKANEGSDGVNVRADCPRSHADCKLIAC